MTYSDRPSVCICVRFSKIHLPSHRLQLNRTNHAQRSPIGVHRLALCSIFKNIFPSTDFNSTKLIYTAIAHRCASPCTVFDIQKYIFPATDFNSTKLIYTAIAHRCASPCTVFDIQKYIFPATDFNSTKLIYTAIAVHLCQVF
ncbi:hypothetical protein H6G66_02050 [Fischerella sp. FACHB-380]|nr:hypothetical protein [Fischerella sp. FACHB-380]